MKDSPEAKLFRQALGFINDIGKDFYITPRKSNVICLGRRLEKQGVWLREAIAKEPGQYPYLRSEEKQDEFFKDLIIFMHNCINKASLLTSNTGLYLIPSEIFSDLVVLARNFSYALNYCRVVPMSYTEKTISKEETKFSVAWVDEEGEIIAGQGEFGKITLQARDMVTLKAKKLCALAVSSNELLEDTAVDLVGVLTEQFLDAMGQELDNQMLNGDGALVSGILTAACGNSIVLSGAAFSTVTSTNISEAIAKIEQGYLANARFIVGRTQAHYLRNCKDDALRPIFIAGNTGAPGTGNLYGWPMEISEQISSTDGTGKPLGVFGNFRKFIIGQRIGSGAEITVDPFTLFAKNQTQFKIVSRWGLDYGDKNAFCRIING